MFLSVSAMSRAHYHDIPVPKRRSKKIPKLNLATALLLMYDCFEKKIVADATSDRVQALVRGAALPSLFADGAGPQ